MPDLGIWGSSAPYHIISYGTLLGTEFFQSFVGGVVAYKSLPRPAFATLQTQVFPVYFGIQTALPAVMALTYPRGEGGFKALLAPEQRYAGLLPIGTIFVTGLINAVWLGPLTRSTMRERKHQETRDGKKSFDAGPHSPQMQALNKKFARIHGISSLINLVGFIATVAYAGTLAGMLR